MSSNHSASISSSAKWQEEEEEEKKEQESATDVATRSIWSRGRSLKRIGRVGGRRKREEIWGYMYMYS